MKSTIFPKVFQKIVDLWTVLYFASGNCGLCPIVGGLRWFRGRAAVAAFAPREEWSLKCSLKIGELDFQPSSCTGRSFAFSGSGFWRGGFSPLLNGGDFPLVVSRRQQSWQTSVLFALSASFLSL